MPTRFNLQKAIGEQKMRKAIAAGLCKCPIETQRVRKAIATGLFDLNALKMNSKPEYPLACSGYLHDMSSRVSEHVR